MTGGKTGLALWRTMVPADIPQVVAIAAEVHPDFYEEEAVFAERQRLFSAGALLLEQAGRAVGYVLSHPWFADDPPKLNTPLGAIPAPIEACHTYYIHDLALLPCVRGTHAASTAVDSLAELARSLAYPSMALVAVNGSRRFWERNGFQVVDRPALSGRLLSYERSAVLMVRGIDRNK